MATCDECIHREPCGAKGGILKDFSTGKLRQDVEKRCEHFKDKSQYVEVVMCKDCAHAVEHKKYSPVFFKCDGCSFLRGRLVSSTFWCKCGERKPSE